MKNEKEKPPPGAWLLVKEWRLEGGKQEAAAVAAFTDEGRAKLYAQVLYVSDEINEGQGQPEGGLDFTWRPDEGAQRMVVWDGPPAQDAPPTPGYYALIPLPLNPAASGADAAVAGYMKELYGYLSAPPRVIRKVP